MLGGGVPKHHTLVVESIQRGLDFIIWKSKRSTCQERFIKELIQFVTTVFPFMYSTFRKTRKVTYLAEVIVLPSIESIKQQRLKIGMTQKELANQVGVSTSMINQIESGRSAPSYETAKKIFEVLEKQERGCRSKRQCRRFMYQKFSN